MCVFVCVCVCVRAERVCVHVSAYVYYVHVLYMLQSCVYNVLQEAAINVFSTIKKYLDDHTMRKLVLPKAKALFTKSTNVRVCSPM